MSRIDYRNWDDNKESKRMDKRIKTKTNKRK